MKRILLPLVLVPFLLTGCASDGYYSDYPGYYYGPGYYDGPDVGIAFVGGDFHHHYYHHYDRGSSRGFASSRGSFHSSGRFASANVSASAHASHGGGRSASVSSGAVHTGGGHR